MKKPSRKRSISFEQAVRAVKQKEALLQSKWHLLDQLQGIDSLLRRGGAGVALQEEGEANRSDNHHENRCHNPQASLRTQKG